MNDVVIVSYARTPMGSFNGSLSSLSAVQLGSIAIKGAMDKVPALRPAEVDEVLMGCVLQSNLGQSPCRQAALGAGLPHSASCSTINKVCASSMKAISLAAQSIRLGDCSVAVVGGMESMSNAPHFLPTMRKGVAYGPTTVTDCVARDGLTDAYTGESMGTAAELCAVTHKITREQQDEYAKQSFVRAADAWKGGKFSAYEVVPVSIKDKKGNVSVVTEDEVYKMANFAKMVTLKPCFKPAAEGGTVTAANSSPLSDGACAMVLMSAAKAASLGITPIAKVLACADAAQAPEVFTTSPALAIPKALQKANLSMEQVDCFEINEAFAVVACANMQLLNIPPEKINQFGGAVALGHPLGCSGARVVCTLMTVLSDAGRAAGAIGAAGICNGGGGASAVVIQRL